MLLLWKGMWSLFLFQIVLIGEQEGVGLGEWIFFGLGDSHKGLGAEEETAFMSDKDEL